MLKLFSYWLLNIIFFWSVSTFDSGLHLRSVATENLTDLFFWLTDDAVRGFSFCLSAVTELFCFLLFLVYGSVYAQGDNPYPFLCIVLVLQTAGVFSPVFTFPVIPEEPWRKKICFPERKTGSPGSFQMPVSFIRKIWRYRCFRRCRL